MGTVSRDLAGLFEFESLERAVVTLKCGAIFLLSWRVASKVTLNGITYRYKDLIFSTSQRCSAEHVARRILSIEQR